MYRPGGFFSGDGAGGAPPPPGAPGAPPPPWLLPHGGPWPGVQRGQSFVSSASLPVLPPTLAGLLAAMDLAAMDEATPGIEYGFGPWGGVRNTMAGEPMLALTGQGTFQLTVLVPVLLGQSQRTEEEVRDIGTSWTHNSSQEEDPSCAAVRHTQPSEGRPAILDACGICLENFNHGDKLTALPCAEESCPSVWHTDCIRSWLRQGRAQSCPLCRAAAGPENDDRAAPAVSMSGIPGLSPQLALELIHEPLLLALMSPRAPWPGRMTNNSFAVTTTEQAPPGNLGIPGGFLASALASTPRPPQPRNFGNSASVPRHGGLFQVAPEMDASRYSAFVPHARPPGPTTWEPMHMQSHRPQQRQQQLQQLQQHWSSARWYGPGPDRTRSRREERGGPLSADIGGRGNRRGVGGRGQGGNSTMERGSRRDRPTMHHGDGSYGATTWPVNRVRSALGGNWR